MNLTITRCFVLAALLTAACGGAEPRPASSPPAPEQPEAPAAQASTSSPEPDPGAAPSSTPSAAPAGKPHASSEPPVATGPLKGVAFGKPFTPRSAIALEDPATAGRKRVTVYDAKVDCATWSKETPGRIEFSAAISWSSGAAADLDKADGRLLRREKDAPASVGNLKGRVELVGDPPSKPGSKGKVRLRVTDGSAENRVEGEIEFVLCQG